MNPIDWFDSPLGADAEQKKKTKVCLANNPPRLQILPHAKFHPNRTTGSKVMAINPKFSEIAN